MILALSKHIICNIWQTGNAVGSQHYKFPMCCKITKYQKANYDNRNHAESDRMAL